MKRPIETRQRGVECLTFTFDGVANANSFSQGANQFSLTTDIGTGNWLFAIDVPGARFLHASFTPHDSDAIPQLDISECSGSAFEVLFHDDAGSPVDVAFSAAVFISSDSLDR